MLSDITSVVGLAGLILSIILLAWQTRAVAEQTKISNSIAGASVASQSADGIREIYMLFMDNPRLRPYFYGGKACPRRGSQRKRIITLAEVFADALESVLFGYKIVPSSRYLDPWTSYCHHMLEVSPTLTGPRIWPSTVVARTPRHDPGYSFMQTQPWVTPYRPSRRTMTHCQASMNTCSTQDQPARSRADLRGHCLDTNHDAKPGLTVVAWARPCRGRAQVATP